MKVGEKILVYGTLRPGRSAEKTMQGMSKHIRTTRFPGKIYNLGWFPGVKLVGNGDPDSFVEADLFEITDEKLPGILDAYEGYPTLYDRRKVPTECGEEAWVYVINGVPMEETRIESGKWE